MGFLKVLDCTLRDGGYCNEWRFGNRNTKTIAASLVEANVDIVELGFLTNRVSYDPEVTKYTDLAQMAAMIPTDRAGKLFVCMVNYGEFELEQLPEYDGSSVDGIRVAFHKRDRYEALRFCEGIKNKGYKVFIQAMVSLNYTDEEFLELIRLSSAFMPYAFYIVDSFGVMKRRDLLRLFYTVEHNLAQGIAIGYHAHNNMQLAYSNAQALVDIRTNRDRIIDSSVFGMGRGAGNLNTELFVAYLNDNLDTDYRIKPLLGIIDRILNRFYQMAPWGYSLPNYLSAKHNAHPNYAGWLDGRKTLTVEDMDSIFQMMEPDKLANYDKAYIEELYLRYLATGQVQELHLQELKKRISGNRVLIIAPGRSSVEEFEKIRSMAGEADVVTIAINFDYQLLDTEFIFLSNLRRFRELSPEKYGKCIVTSNIPAMGVYLQTSYRELLNNTEAVRDNAGMMLVRLLIQLGAREILVAGMDGYDTDPSRNYADQSMAFYTRKAQMEAMNAGMSAVLSEYSRQIPLHFVTEPKFVRIEA
jgi:4-hydroxy 2-oxovalerate aldolase